MIEEHYMTQIATSTIKIFIILRKRIIRQSASNQRRGAAEARRAHNPDVLGSKPSGASTFISFFLLFSINDECLNFSY